MTTTTPLRPASTPDANQRLDRLQSPIACGTPGQPTAEVERLQEEIEQLRDAISSQRQIGTAIGLIAHRYNCSLDQAWSLLTRLSNTSNVKVRHIAGILIRIHEGTDPDADPVVLASIATQLP